MKNPNIKELDACKHCSSKLNRSDVRLTTNKEMSPRYGICWAGIEHPFIKVFKITCPNYKCGKSYSYKYKSSRYIYK